jgi:hypothetical protein
MDDYEQNLLDALQSGEPGGERYQRVMVAFDRIFNAHRARLTDLISARARAARLSSDEVLIQTICNACERLKNQAEGKGDRFEFTGNPKFEGWVMANAGSHKKKEKGGVIPTMLRSQWRKGHREQTNEKYDDVPDESHDETKALLQSFNLEERLAAVDPKDRCLLELDLGALSAPPSADIVVAHALRSGMTASSVDALRRRASRMAWPARRGHRVYRGELAMLFRLTENEVRDRIRSTILHLRKGLDLDVSPRPHWSSICGRRKTVTTNQD